MTETRSGRKRVEKGKGSEGNLMVWNRNEEVGQWVFGECRVFVRCFV